MTLRLVGPVQGDFGGAVLFRDDEVLGHVVVLVVPKGRAISSQICRIRSTLSWRGRGASALVRVEIRPCNPHLNS